MVHQRKASHHVSASCSDERCGMCLRLYDQHVAATHKVGEEIAHDDPNPVRHNLTQYVCCKHYCDIMGPFAEQHVCFPNRIHLQQRGDVDDD